MPEQIIHKNTEEEITLALKWFEDAEIHVYHDDGSIFLSQAEADLELSQAEVAYRASLQTLEN